MFHKSLPDPYAFWLVPTEEDRLDINFRSIVSDLKSIISGHLAPRMWSDISSTWHEQPKEAVRPRKVYDYRAQAARKAAYQKKRYAVRRVTQILVKQGMDPVAAFTKATKLMEDE